MTPPAASAGDVRSAAPTAGGGGGGGCGTRWTAPISGTGATLYFHVPPPPSPDAPPPPVVVLLGWLGAPPAHLAKYAALYASRGVATAATTAPTGVILCIHPEAGQQAFTAALLTTLADAVVPAAAPGAAAGRPLLGASGLAWHAFSSGGSYICRALSTLVWGGGRDSGGAGRDGPVPAAAAALSERSRAVVAATSVGGVLDSAPAPMDLDAAVTGVSLASWGSTNGLRPALVRAVFLAYSAVQVVVAGDVAARYWADMRRLRLDGRGGGGAGGGGRLAFWYSTGDAVLGGPAGVARLEAAADAAGARTWRVDGAPHVQLGRVFPEKYGEQVDETVMRWLGEWRDGQAPDGTGGGEEEVSGAAGGWKAHG